eukprot:44970_1
MDFSNIRMPSTLTTEEMNTSTTDQKDETLGSDDTDEIEMEAILGRVLSVQSADIQKAHPTNVHLVAFPSEEEISMIEYERKESAANIYVAVDLHNTEDDSDDHHPNAVIPDNAGSPPLSPPSIDTKHHIQFKWYKFCTTSEFLGRILLLVLSFILLILSTAYCMGQWYDSTLKLITHCDGKDITDIYEHSYHSGLQDNGEVKLNHSSQWGWTNEPCWTTKTRETNTNDLWYSNVYSAYVVEHPVNVQSIAFGLISVYCLCIIVYNIHSLITDVISASGNKLHTTSKRYKDFMDNQKRTNNVTPPKVDSWCTRKCRIVVGLWDKYMSHDTTGWVVKGIMSEICEIVVQTNALFLYNGYNILDPQNKQNIYLANQPHFIIIFAAILSFNCLASGMLWCSYALMTKYCHGLLFKLLLFCVDQLSDLFYIFFPFIMIIFDDYNADIDSSNVLVLLAQLNTTSALIAFLSSSVPLLLLCTKTLLIIRTARKQLANKYYSHWKFVNDIAKQKDDDVAVYQAQLAGWKLDVAALQNNNKEMFGSKGDLLLSLNRQVTRTNWIQDDVNHKVSFKKQCWLLLISLIYIVYGVGVLWFSLDHIQHAQDHCKMIDERNYFINETFNVNSTKLNSEQHKLLLNNPELFFWNKCLYKVYPFSDENSMYHHQCQCRVLVINWEETISTVNQRRLYFNLTQSIILRNMLTHWYQLEKFRTLGQEEQAVRTAITKSMFVAKHMKAFEWEIAKINCIERGISGWTHLEYFKLKDTLVYQIPDDFKGLNAMKYVSFEGNALQTIPDSICTLANLQMLEIYLEFNVKSIPKCISNLINLEQLIIDDCVLLENIPLGIFNLSKLVMLSIFHNAITTQSLIEYNAPADVNTNDTEWLSNALLNTLLVKSFKSNHTEYYLSLNPICDQNITWLPNDLHQFMSKACDFPCDLSAVKDIFCSPRLLSDGKCDLICDTACFSDFGDCVQLCFAPQLTECTFELYTNDVCDKECDNDYCQEYFNPTLQTKKIRIRDELVGPDMWNCAVNNSVRWQYEEQSNVSLAIASNSSNITCSESTSSYVSDEFRNKFDFYAKCEDVMIGDTQCDDMCRTDECNQDGGDCEPGSCALNVCKFIYDAWISFFGPSTYNVNRTHFCDVYRETIFPTLGTLFGTDHWTDAFVAYPCTNASDYDFNEDRYVNFREFTFLAYWMSDGMGTRLQKAKQVNCSDCIGMAYYNVKSNVHTNQNATVDIDTCHND